MAARRSVRMCRSCWTRCFSSSSCRTCLCSSSRLALRSSIPERERERGSVGVWEMLTFYELVVVALQLCSLLRHLSLLLCVHAQCIGGVAGSVSMTTPKQRKQAWRLSH